MRKQLEKIMSSRRRLFWTGGLLLLFFVGILVLIVGAGKEKKYAGMIKDPEDREETRLELSEDDYYKIYDEKDYIRFWKRVRSGEYELNGRLMADIYINDSETILAWKEEGAALKNKVPGAFYYKGTFDGNGHTVYGIYSKDGYGVVGDNDGTIMNLTVCDAYVVGENLSGGICSSNNGTIYNCNFSGIIECTLGEIGNTIGGICIFNEGVIERCGFEGEMYETKREKWTFEIAGICRFNDGEVKDCYNLTDMSAEDAAVAYAIADENETNCYMLADSGWEASEDGQIISLDKMQCRNIDAYIEAGLYESFQNTQDDHISQYVCMGMTKGEEMSESGLLTGLFCHDESDRGNSGSGLNADSDSTVSVVVVNNDCFSQDIKEKKNETIRQEFMEDEKLAALLWNYAEDKNYAFSECRIEACEDSFGHAAEVSFGRGVLSIGVYPSIVGEGKEKELDTLWQACAELLGEKDAESFSHYTYGLEEAESVVLYDRVTEGGEEWEAGFFYLTPEKTYKICGTGYEAMSSMETVRVCMEEGRESTVQTFLATAFREMKGRQVPVEFYEWQDMTVKQVVYDALFLEEGQMVAAETLFMIEDLVISNVDEVTTFDDLSMCVNLKSLAISDGEIEDTAFLTGLTELTSLYLPNCGLTDISFVEEMPHLTDVSFYGNGITDISPLAACPKLTVLSLAYNEVEDISVLSSLTELEELGIHYNKIESLAPLAELKQLKGVNFSFNEVRDLSPLSSLTQLEALGAVGNQITDISALAELTNIDNLSLDLNEITDISALSGMYQMKWLGLSHNQITDYESIQDMEELFYLSVNGNPGQDIGEKVLVPELSVGRATAYSEVDRLADAAAFFEEVLPGREEIIEDMCFGDINGDGIRDAALTACYGRVEKEDGSIEDWGRRHVYLFLGKDDGSYRLAETVETRDPTSGGVYGDPYRGIALAGNKLIVQNYGGSAFRWLDTRIYEWSEEYLKETYHTTLNNYVHAPGGYDYYVVDVKENTEKYYAITGEVEGDMEMLLLFDTALESGDALREQLTEEKEAFEEETGIALPEIDDYFIMPETGSSYYTYTVHASLYETEYSAEAIMKKAAEEFLSDAKKLPITEYTSAEIKANYDKLTGVVLPEYFYLGVLSEDTEVCQMLVYVGCEETEAGLVHTLAFKEPTSDNDWWLTEKTIRFYETGSYFEDEYGDALRVSII